AQKRLFSRSSLMVGIVMYPLGVFSYQPGILYSITTGLTATGLFIILAHVTKLLDHTARAGSVIATVGVYSYGLYLLHQPYVIYFGHKLTPYGMGVFLAVAVVVTALLTVGSIQIEKRVNDLTSRLLGDKPKGPLDQRSS
ncbi:MAG: acyltransferase family protein, partial [Acidobacteriota bacterium]